MHWSTIVVLTCITVLAKFSIIVFAAAPASSSSTFEIPPVAAEIKGLIEEVELGPVFIERYFCVEHALELNYAGDALGTDCQVGSEVAPSTDGFFKLYRSDGKTNADWYGWHANVLAPFDGTVIYAFHAYQENNPGVLGSSPAGTLRFKNAAGVIVNYGHVTEIAVKAGDRVKAGQVVAKVGNNGQSRAPHIHIGAYREVDSVPLQIRWDLRAMAKARDATGIN